MLHRDLGRVFDSRVGLQNGLAASLWSQGGFQRWRKCRDEATRSHGAGDADLALAADLGAGDGGVFLVENPNGRRGQEVAEKALGAFGF